jgi:hypothetical protein
VLLLSVAARLCRSAIKLTKLSVNGAALARREERQQPQQYRNTHIVNPGP